MPARADSARISGVVLSDEPSPRPLRRARVLLNGPVGQTTITEDDGTFAFTDLPTGSYTVGAVKEAYVPMNFGARRTGRRGTSITLAPGGSANVAISLAKGAVITGVISDVDGLPAPGATVELMVDRFDPRQGDRRLVRHDPAKTIVTDDRGVYRAFGLPPGEYVVCANRVIPASEVRLMSAAPRAGAGIGAIGSSPVCYPGTVIAGEAMRVSARAGEERAGVDFSLQYVPTAVISGTVARPGDDAHVSVVMNRADGSGEMTVRHASDSGQFRFAGVRAGTYLLTARVIGATEDPDNTRIATAEITVDGQDVNVTLSPQPTVTIVGRVVFEGGAETRMLVSNLDVHGMAALSNSNVVLSPIRETGDGGFGLHANVPGLYHWTAELPGLHRPLEGWWLKSFLVNGRDVLDGPLELKSSTQDASLILSKSASELNGLVRDAKNQPDVGRRLIAFSTDRRHWFFHSRRVAAGRTTDGGRYSIRNLPPGEYFVALDREELDDNEWFDPLTLERLIEGAARVRIEGTEKIVLDLPAR
jgi:uncharacterized protein (DUF2141 family)